MTSAFAKSSTLIGLSGFLTNGFVRTTLPVGDVNRKMDQENHSILTGPAWARAADGARASHTDVATIIPRSQCRLVITASSRLSIAWWRGLGAVPPTKGGSVRASGGVPRRIAHRVAGGQRGGPEGEARTGSVRTEVGSRYPGWCRPEN